jgi:hypothetical protein
MLYFITKSIFFEIFYFLTTNLPLTYHQHNTIYHIKYHLDFSVN